MRFKKINENMFHARKAEDKSLLRLMLYFPRRAVSYDWRMAVRVQHILKRSQKSSYFEFYFDLFYFLDFCFV